MRRKVYDYFNQIATRENLLDAKTLDVGSLDINGSLRPIFKDYTGMDMREGKNVDVVANGHEIPFGENTFDCVVCAETLEHDDFPQKTIDEIHRVIKPGGWLILAAPGPRFPIHNYPSDYWRFTAEAFKVLMRNFRNVEAHGDNDETFGCGQK